MQLVAIKPTNRDLLSDTTSGLSVRLASGELDPREPLSEINDSLEQARLSDAERGYLEGVKRQLIFREFARSALEAQSYRQPGGAEGKDSDAWQRLEAGRTGLPIIDACLADLKGGLPHNRARLLLVRYLIRNLNLDPLLVAEFYRRQLSDYCPVINTFNVVSAASGATFGEPPYRLSNPLTAQKKLDPARIYMSRYGLANMQPTEDGIATIREGSKLWLARWHAARDAGEWTTKPLWPTRDKDRGKYFILGRIPARGAFAPYYRQYLQRERELLST